MTLPAPLDELPLLVSEGAVIPLLDPAVETLADYGTGAAVRLRDRDAPAAAGMAAGPAHRFTRQPAGAAGPRRQSPPRRPPQAGSWTYRGTAHVGTSSRRRSVRSKAAHSGPVVSTPDVAADSVGRWRYNEATGVFKMHLNANDARLVVRRCGA